MSFNIDDAASDNVDFMCRGPICLLLITSPYMDQPRKQPFICGSTALVFKYFSRNDSDTYQIR